MRRLLLHELTPQGVRHLGECLTSGEGIGLGPEHQVAVREVSIGDLEALKEEVARSTLDRPALDGLIAPMLHEALPLGRALGARPQMWAWLGATELWPVLQKRWPPRGPAEGDGEAPVSPRARVLGSLTVHGLARLWWAAELTVDPGAGDPYADTRRFVKGQYLVDRLLKSEMSRNRSVLLGILDGLDWRVEWRRINRVVAALAVLETTVCLDALVRTEVASIVRGFLVDVSGEIQ